MTWKEIVKAKGWSNREIDAKTNFRMGQAIAKDLNLVGEDNYEKRFEVIMDEFSIDIEVSNVEQRWHDSAYPTETFAIRVKPEGKIELYDNELDSIVKVFTQKDIVIDLDGSKPEPMEEKSGAFLFKTTFMLGDYDDGKIFIGVKI